MDENVKHPNSLMLLVAVLIVKTTLENGWAISTENEHLHTSICPIIQNSTPGHLPKELSPSTL